ncbi:MAG: ribosomal L7Ae/L30e/S12e/Gadd45 family protein [Oscillospiraceae bacterium]|jgi:ribosomal protein L7Ae-like RNA K-turn-binding protein|nr:ribosomal L7Ae/L30e/S12e/Gadd45 family protein [Oscillospiraceae bacterium]
MYESFLSFLGIARRAGKLHLGFSASASYSKRGLARLILVCEDISANSFKKVGEIAARSKDLSVIKIKLSKDDIGFALGKRSGIITVTDRGFAKNIFKLMSEFEVNL